MSIIFAVLDKNKKLSFVDFSNNKNYELKIKDGSINLEEVNNSNINEIFQIKEDSYELPKELEEMISMQTMLQNKNFYQEFKKESKNE